MKDYSLGFDIGGTKCAVILGDKKTNDYQKLICDKIKFETKVKRGYKKIIDELFVSTDLLLNRNNLTVHDISGIGISCGGPLNGKTGVIMSPPNLPDWDSVPIVKMCHDRFGLISHLCNDADACAVAEWKYGAGRGTENMIFLTFGTGMGAGLILNGKLYTGSKNLAGEVGHIRLADDGPLGYGKHGSFEGFCSGGGIAAAAKTLAGELIKQGTPPMYCQKPEDLPDVSARSVAEWADKGDKDALKIYESCGEYLGKGLAILIDILNPQRIVIGSIFSRSQNLLIKSMTNSLKSEALACSLEGCEIVPAELGEHIGDYAALGIAP